MNKYTEKKLGTPKTLFMRSLLLLLAFSILGCTQNLPYRTDPAASCLDITCDTSAWLEHHQGFDLAFVEFTERGNVFKRSHMNQVLEYAEELAETDTGTAVVVFVHGWKHNAKATDDNVLDFRWLLQKTAKLRAKGRLPKSRKLLGIYIGWRGLSLNLEPLTNVTYWDRKQVAHQVGKGGVTEFLLRLERMVIDPNDSENENKNLLLITGHSFGGTIVLSSLNEGLLVRVLAAEAASGGEWADTGCDCCVESRPFGHGVA